MKWLTDAEDKTSSFLIDHPKTKKWTIWVGKFIIEAISAFIFAYGFRAFISPTIECVKVWAAQASSSGPDPTTVNALISGGASGISQAIIKFIEIFPVDLIEHEKTLVSILYFVINVPILLLSWFKISKQFTIFTLINVGFVSLFNQIIPDDWIYNVVNIYNDHLARAIFAGITTGVSSGLALMIGTSSGGVDVISLYISEKKSTSVGKYSLIANTITVICYVLFSAIGSKTNDYQSSMKVDNIVTMALYTVVYFFVSSQVVDILNIKNRKQELQIITSDSQLATVLIRSFPHSCSIIDSKGAFSGKKNFFLIMVISKSEVKKAVKMVKERDPLAFMTIVDINQVYGRFYIKPIE